MARIAFVDDEHGPIDYYVDALRESGHDVEQIDTVENKARLVKINPDRLFV